VALAIALDYNPVFAAAFSRNREPSRIYRRTILHQEFKKPLLKVAARV
jgi:hypothetical protein